MPSSMVRSCLKKGGIECHDDGHGAAQQGLDGVDHIEGRRPDGLARAGWRGDSRTRYTVVASSWLRLLDVLVLIDVGDTLEAGFQAAR